MVYPYLQFGQNIAQRLANTPAGQTAAGYMQRGGEALGRFENRWPAMARGPMGQFPARTAADKVPLAPVSGSLAGAAGVGSAATGGVGSFGTLSNPFASPAPSNMQDVFGQLDRQTREQLGPPMPTGMSVMDSIMAGRQGNMMYDRPGLPDDALGGFPSAPPAAASGFVPPANIPMPPSRPRDLPGRTPGFLDQLLSGTDYQSNSMPVDIRAQGPSMPGQQMPIQSINWGDAQNPADFFRADQLAQQLRAQDISVPGFLGGY